MQIEATEISNDATAVVATSLGRAAILPLLSGDVMGVVYCHYYDRTIANSALVFGALASSCAACCFMRARIEKSKVVFGIGSPL